MTMRMYRFEEDQQRSSRGGGCQQRMISLRKYSLAICVVEFVAILLFVYLLMQQAQQPFRPPTTTLFREPGDVSKLYRTYSNGANSSRFLIDLVSGCDQRKHDLAFGVECLSSNTELCSSEIQGSFQVGGNPAAKVKRDLQSDEDDSLPALVVTTSMDGDRLKQRSVRLPKQQVAHNCGIDPLCPEFKTRAKIQPNERGQKIIGWGGALSDSSINNILALTTNATRRLLDDYFARPVDGGLNFNLIRITIGGSDFSSRFYTNDDSRNGEDDFQFKEFALKEEDILYKIPLIKFIKNEYDDGGQQQRIKLFGSMWSPPVWMKTNNHFNKGFLRGSINDEPITVHNISANEAYFNALAELKVKFLQAYGRESIDFWGLTVMNEPIFAIQPFLPFNTMIFPMEDYANYIAKYLGPKLKSDNKLRLVKLMAHDDNRRYLINFTSPILKQTRVKQYIDGVSVHGYVDEAYDQMDDLYFSYNDRLDPDFFILPTELSSAHLPFMQKALIGNWHRGIHYALDIIRSLQHSAAGWVDWNMALDLEGGPGWLGGRLDAPVIVDKARDVYYKSPMFYVLGQFSRYIPPGSIKIRTQMFNDKFDNHFEVVTFALPRNNERRYTTVVVNNNPYSIELNLEIQDEDNNASATTTTNKKNGKIYQLTCTANSVTTIVY